MINLLLAGVQLVMYWVCVLSGIDRQTDGVGRYVSTYLVSGWMDGWMDGEIKDKQTYIQILWITPITRDMNCNIIYS